LVGVVADTRKPAAKVWPVAEMFTKGGKSSGEKANGRK
jgi:hypothetical protein